MPRAAATPCCRLLVLGALLAAALPAHAPPALPHAVAYVTDSLSHGTVGDGLLSLNEAIRLHNGTLPLAQLSAAELAQVSLIPGTGSTTDVTWIDIDGSSTPVISIERDLDPVLDTTFGLLIKGFNYAPVLDFSGANIAHGLRVPANSFEMQDVILSGGPYGIDVVQTDAAGQVGTALLRVQFLDQAQFGLRVRCTQPGGLGRLVLEDCAFRRCGNALLFDEAVLGRTTIFEALNLDIEQVATGIDIVLGAGGSGRYVLDRLAIDATAVGLRLQRPAGADRAALLDSTHVRVRAPSCVEIAASPAVATTAQLRMWDLRAPTGGSALQLGALGDRLVGSLEDSTLEGDVTVRAGGGSQPLTLRNLRCRGGSVHLGSAAGQPLDIADSRFDGPLQSQGSRALACAGCCFTASLAGTASAPIVTSASYVAAAGAFVQQAFTLPSAQLGSMSIAPETATLGGTVQLLADLPPGLVGVFVLGFTDPFPLLLPAPLHVYSLPNATFATGILVRGQQSLPLSIPPQPWFAGLDCIAQIVALPDPTLQAPWIQLPPGRRFVIR